ncbi:MAG: protein serine/threonine phosphatase, partial [Bacteroidetes bacterium]|nr:protein serine/threonine phosphatase [Bacteroidota bacterium]
MHFPRVKHTFLFFAFIISSLYSGQTNSVKDSLQHLLKNAKDDSTRCVILNKLIETEEDNAVWPAYNDQFHDISKKNAHPGNPSHRYFAQCYANSLNNYGYINMILGNKPKAYEFYYQAFEAEKKNQNKDGMANVLVNLGYLYNQDGNVPKAIETYHEALKIKIQLNDQWTAATIYNNLGFIFFKQEEYPKAHEYYLKALNIYEKLKYVDGIATSCLNLSYYYSKSLSSGCADADCKKKNLIKAHELLQRSEKLYRENNNESGLGSVLNVRGGLYETAGDPFCDAGKEDCSKQSQQK